MSIESATLRRSDILATFGQAALSSQFPDDFEVYIAAFELVNSAGKTEKFFLFPVMPSSIRESQPKITNIRKTAGGVTVLTTPNFIPVDITLSGNFGRKFRFIMGSTVTDLINNFNSSDLISQFKDGSIVKNTFDQNIKTGYGCIKILEDIIKSADQLDSKGEGYKLIFYNLALGNSYYVKPMNIEFSQSQDSNMIWNYTLSLKGIAPLSAYGDKNSSTSNSQLIITDYTQKKVDGVINGITNLITKITTR